MRYRKGFHRRPKNKSLLSVRACPKYIPHDQFKGTLFVALHRQKWVLTVYKTGSATGLTRGQLVGVEYTSPPGWYERDEEETILSASTTDPIERDNDDSHAEDNGNEEDEGSRDEDDEKEDEERDAEEEVHEEEDEEEEDEEE